MTVTLAAEGFALTISPAEREQLLVIAELALALRTGDRASVRALTLDLDAVAVDRLADALFCVARD